MYVCYGHGRQRETDDAVQRGDGERVPHREGRLHALRLVIGREARPGASLLLSLWVLGIIRAVIDEEERRQACSGVTSVRLQQRRERRQHARRGCPSRGETHPVK